MLRFSTSSILALAIFSQLACGAGVEIQRLSFQIPDGYELQLAAGPPLVDRPITVAYDEQGRLYVSESSGSNDPVEQQLQERPHRILRLEDLDGDGVYDERTVFADRMMFPAGTMWLDGSLYVAAPPSIWKLTDTDSDGVCDEREEWFDGKTLTYCANDLHGPYLGRDGWIYWCKGAFAEQTYERFNRDPLVTRAAHIFRRHPDGGPIEAVMTGGMDNPVDVVFSPGGELFFTTTFVQHPAGGQRDGLVHAIYGGVYGKQHGVIDSHPRTGPLMPVMTHLGAAAPSGLALLESDELGYQGDLVAALFNMQRVTRHELVPYGATFKTRDSDLVVCDSIDFHPTDVVEDMDGSLLIVDTGGWYKLCCPTSQLWKPDVLGGIYRLKKQGAHEQSDPRGLDIAWDSLTAARLGKLLEDPRFAVRRRAGDQLVQMGDAAVGALSQVARDSPATARLAAAWALGRIGTPSAIQSVRTCLGEFDDQVRQAMIHIVALYRDAASFEGIAELLESGTPGNQRAAAEALGRIGGPQAVDAILARATRAHDRVMEHSLTYALIEIGRPALTSKGLAASKDPVKRMAMTALDQMDPSTLTPEIAIAHFSASQSLRERALWIAGRHPEWTPELANYLTGALREPLTEGKLQELEPMLISWADQPEAYYELGLLLTSRNVPLPSKLTALDAVNKSRLETIPQDWSDAGVLVKLLDSGQPQLIEKLLAVFAERPPVKLTSAEIDSLSEIERDDSASNWRRLAAIAVMTAPDKTLAPPMFDLILPALKPDRPEPERSLAADIVGRCQLDPLQCERLIESLDEIGPLEIDRVVSALARSGDNVATKTIQTLADAKSIASLPEQRLREIFAESGADVRQELDAFVERLQRGRQEQRQALIQLAENLPPGDARRGQAVFHSPQASCNACHRLGYLGGEIGPDLTRIGETRSRHDLLEAILFPSASFVRSFEPLTIVTADGRTHTGLVRDETSAEVLLVNADRKEVRIDRDDIEQMAPSEISIMPAGLQQQLTPQQLADLVELLLSAG